MKKKTHSLSLKLVALSLSLLFINFGFSQTIYNNYQDGRIWFKLKDNQIIHPALSKDGTGKMDLNNLKLSTMPYLANVFAAHEVTKLAQPFPQAYGSNALLKTYLLEFDDINNIDNLINELEQSGFVDYAEKIPLDKIDLTPNDQYYNSNIMWSLFQVDAENAWDIGTGSSSIIVATTDNAIETAHPDLVNVLWTNPGEVPNDGIDNDGNGYIDDINGFDVGDNDNDPSPPNAGFDHGTHVAGTTGAQSNNNIGVASIGYGISIMAVKSTRNNAGSNSVTDGYNGIYYATVSGAHVINCSWGGTGSSTTGLNIVNFAWNSGSIVVAAAGNDGTDNDAIPHYPSNYTNAIAVASSTTGDVKSGFSNYGTNSIDITAPGSNIASTTPYGDYDYMSGTSMASPMVAGLLGLMKSLNPSMPNADLVNCMYSSADNIDANNPSYAGELGAGRINAYAAMTCVSATLNNAPTANFEANYTAINAGGTVTFTDLSAFNPTGWTWNFDAQGLGGASPSTANSQGPHNVTYSNVGVYEVTLTATNTNGSDTETKTAYINVTAAGACEIINYDTTSFPYNTAWSPALYGAQNGGQPYGYIAGVNGYDDKAKTDYFNASQTSGFDYMIGTYVFFGNGYSNTPSKTIDVNVYDGTGGTVGAIIATKTLDMSFVMANLGMTYIDFDNAVSIPTSGEVFVGVDFSNLSYAAGDTLGIVSNSSGESTPNTAWEKWSDDTWHDYSSAWGVDVSHYIMPWLTNDTAVAQISASPVTLCEGEIVSYDATGSTFQDTLVWTFNGVSSVNSSNVNEDIIYNNTGTYTTYLEVLGGGCGSYAIDSVTIIVNETPNPAITTPNDTICNGTSVTLTASGGNSYLWSPGAQTTTSILVSPTVTTTYNVEATTSGCSGNGSKTIYVVSSPTAASTYSPSSNICSITDVNFDGTSSTDVSTYSWSFPAGSPSVASSNSPLPVVNFSDAGTHNYSLTVTNTCGSNTYNGTITIDAATVPTFTQLGPYCQGDTPGTLPTTSNNSITGTWNSAISTTNDGTTTYTFTPSGGCNATTTMDVVVNAPTIPTFTQIGPYCVGDTPGTLPASSNNGISGTWNGAISTTSDGTTTYTFTPTGGCNATTTMDVVVNAPTIPTFTQIGPYCVGETPGALPASSNNGITGTWNSVISTASNGSTTYTFTPDGGCNATTTMDVVVNNPTTPAFTQLGPYCVGDTPDALPTTSNNGITGSWNAAIATNGQGTTTYTFTPQGGGCDTLATMDVTINICTGINTSADVSKFNMYPNPANNRLNLEGLENVKVISLLDVTGKVVFNKANISENTLTIDLSNVGKGMYFIQLETEENISSYKIIKN